jgi:hypothetical protein
VRLDGLGRVFLAGLQIIFVDDLEGECSEDGLFEVPVEERRVVFRDQFHLSGEREIEI